MLRFWQFFLNKSSFSALLVVAVVSFGLFSVAIIPKESAPEIQIPIAVITTVLPGASATDIESLVTDKIEEHLDNTLEDVKTITSRSQQSLSVVVVEFSARANIKESIDSVKDEIDAVKSELPDEAEDPKVSDVNFADQPIQLVSVTSDLSASEFIDLSDRISDVVEGVPGVSRVEKSGIPEREIQVIVNKEKLHAFEISLSQIIAVLARADAALPVGAIEINNIEYAVVFDGEIADPTEIENIVITSRDGISGKQEIYIRDIAFVSNGVSEASSLSRASIEGGLSQQAVTLSVFKKRGGDITRITEEVKDRLAEFESSYKGNVSILIAFDTGEFVKEDLTRLTLTGVQTILLVMLLLFLAIGWREALVAGLSIPLSFLIAFIGLQVSGNTINFISLFSLILAVGILVDSAIVITEGVHSRFHIGDDRKASAEHTIRTFHLPLTSGTMTTVAVFIPLFFISGITGKFIAGIPYTVIFVLIASLFVALAIIPIVASSVLTAKKQSSFTVLQERYTEIFKSWYRTKLENLLGDRKKEHRLFIVMILLFVAALALPITGAVKTTFFSGEDSEFIFIEAEKPAGTTLEGTNLSMRSVEEVLYTYNDIESFVTTVGASSAFGNNPTSGAQFANITVILKDDRVKKSEYIVESLRKDMFNIRNTEVRVLELQDGPPVGAPVFIKFFGDDLNELTAVAEDGENILKNISGTREVRTSAKNRQTEFAIKIDKARAARAGVDAATIAGVLRSAIFGTTATTIREGGEDIDIVVKLALNQNYLTPHDTTRTNIDAIKHLEIPTQEGSVLLGSITKTVLRNTNTVIAHENTTRVVTLSSEVAEGFVARDITNTFKERLEESGISQGVTMKIGGEIEEVDQSFRDMFIALIAGMVLVLAILVLQFNSFRQAAFIIVIVPLSLVGIFFGLWFTGKTLSFPSMMGFIALSGVVVNNAIILIDVMNKRRRENGDFYIKDAVIDGAVSRLRPVVLTTVTTVIGIIPLTYAAAIWSPLAFAIIFGLSFASIVTLFLIPTLYHRFPSKKF